MSARNVSGSVMPYGDPRPMHVAERVFDRFIGDLVERLDDPGLDRDDTCRNAIAAIYGYQIPADFAADESLSLGQRALYASFDPRNVTLEPEYYADIDPDRYRRVKPLTWLWIMFDRSPMGQNAFLGHRLRRALAQRVFRRCGRNIKIWQFVEYTYGYNLSVGDDVVLHRHTFLDDRAGIDIGSHVSISDYVNIYSHSHDINDIRRVELKKTVIEDHVRLTYHATVLAGVTVGKDAMVGSMAVATRSLPGFQVSAGVPARPIRAKDRPCPYCQTEK